MRRAAAALAAATLALALACGGDETWDVSGVVREVHPAESQVKIEHAEIPGVMPAMTMSFDVADPAWLEGLAPGQYVEFRLLRRGGRYAIVALDAPGTDDPAAAGHAGAAPDALADADDAAPDFALTDQHGRPVALRDLRGGPVLLDFVFTRCPGPCPVLTGLHRDVRQGLAPAERARLRSVSVTLDPEHDTPEVLAAYARRRGLDTEGWSFLTGPADAVAAVVRAYGVGAIRNADGDIDHTVATFLIDAEGRIARRYLGLDHAPEAIRDDLRALL
jgi:protein SCO1/2